MSNLYRSQEFKIHSEPERIEFEGIELLKDYDFTIEYHPRKANVVADALSRKSSGNLSHIHSMRIPLLLKLRALNMELAQGEKGALLTTLKV